MADQMGEDRNTTRGIEAEKKDYLSKQKDEDKKETKKTEEEKKVSQKPGKK